MKFRLARVREVLKRELGSIMVKELRFSSPLVTVSDVDITPDLKPYVDRLMAAVKTRAVQEGGGQGARWAELWTRLSELPDRTAGLNMDRGDALQGALADLARTRG